jgi:hypothetical protein
LGISKFGLEENDDREEVNVDVEKDNNIIWHSTKEVDVQVDNNKIVKGWRKELEDAYRIKHGLNETQKKYYSDYEKELIKKIQIMTHLKKRRNHIILKTIN